MTGQSGETNAACGAPPEQTHKLAGVHSKLSICLTDLASLEEPAQARQLPSDQQAVPGSAVTDTTSSPTDSALLEGADDCQTTPEEAPCTSSPWTAADAEGSVDDDDAAAAAAEGGTKAGVRKQAWTKEEDSKLLELVELHGASNWSKIAAGLPTRIGKQCRERWHNHLSPAVKKESFSAEEDHAIMEAVAEHGTKWALIVKLIPGRTDNAIKNRWNSTTRKLLRVQRRCGDLIPGLKEVDFHSMDAAAVAKHLLAHGVTAAAAAAAPPKPSAKRRLSLKGDGGDGEGASTGEAADEQHSSGEPSGKRRKSGGGRSRRGAAHDGLAMLRAATFRSATEALMEAADAADSGACALAADAAATATAAEGASGACAAADERGEGFTLDALTLLAQSSVVRSEEAGCRSPRMLEAALALGGAFDVSCFTKGLSFADAGTAP